MLERFTDRARKVMGLANQEAQRFHHEYIGPEHILMGLIKDGSGVAAAVLRNLDVDLRKARWEIEKLVKAGPEMVTMGKLPQTPKAKEVVTAAINAARDLQHNYVGTEHLLLGMMSVPDTVALAVLDNLGVERDAVREATLTLLGKAHEETPEIAAVIKAVGQSPDPLAQFTTVELITEILRREVSR